MLWKIVVLTLLGVIPATRSSAGFQAPTPGLLESLSRHHDRHDWLRITTDSARYEARVHEFGVHGLNGITSRRGSPATPDFIPWSSVTRIDQVRSGFRAGQIVGGLALGSLAVPTMLNGEPEVAGFVAAGAVVGMGLGGLVVRHWSREHPLYVASPASDSGASVTSRDGGPFSGSPRPAAVAPLDAVRIGRAMRLIGPGQRLRIRGPFGEVDGFMDQAGPRGLEGLRTTRRRAWDAPSPRRLEWESIESIDRRGNSAGRGALVGAASLMPMGLSIGLAVVATSGSSSNGEVLGGALLGTAVGGSIGAVLGGLIGSAIPRWHRVY